MLLRGLGDSHPIFQQKDPPRVVYVALVVPRKKMDHLLSIAVERKVTQRLGVMITNLVEGFSNTFLAIHRFFGRLETNKEQPFICEASKDDEGWQGSSDFIAVTVMPISTLLGNVRDIRISLNVTYAITKSGPEPGPTWEVFGAGIGGPCVKLLNHPPGFVQAKDVRLPDLSSLAVEAPSCAVELDSNSVAKSLVQKVLFQKLSLPSKLLKEGSVVSVKPVSPYTLSVHIGNYQQLLYLPFPINASALKTRVARKSSWVAVIVPLSSATEPGGYERQKFPVLAKESKVFQWGLSNVNIDLLPLVSREKERDFVSVLFGACNSNVEKRLNRPHLPGKSPMVDLKRDIHFIFQSFLGRGIEAFTMGDFDDNSWTIIVVNDLRYDFDNASIVLNAFVLCLTKSRLKKVRGLIEELLDGKMIQVNMSRDEEVLFKHMLPALVERCRGKAWNHLQDCPYFKSDKIPLSTDPGVPPICSCGEGKALESLSISLKNYPALTKFMTRIVLAPISAVGYVEDIIESSDISEDGQSTPAPSVSQGGGEVLTCAHCGKDGNTLMRCARCKKVRYCNKDCQTAAWNKHKKVCT